MNTSLNVRKLLNKFPEEQDLVFAPSLKRRRMESYLALIVADVAAIFLGFVYAGYWYTGPPGGAEALMTGWLLAPIFLTIAFHNSSYSVDSLANPLNGIIRAEIALVISSSVVIFIAFYTKSSAEYSRVAFTLGGISSGLILLWFRFALKNFVAWRCGPNVTNELVINDGGPQVDLPGAIHVSARRLDLRPEVDDPSARDRVGLVLRNIDRVLISCTPERRLAWATMLKGTNVAGEVIHSEVAGLGAQGARVTGGFGWLLVSVGPLRPPARALKRLFDLTISASVLLALLPLLVAVGLAIKFEDGGPVFFLQRRVGRDNRFFHIFKFRSMSVARADADGSTSASRDDQRITRVGKFIRRTSLDELPQLLNVLIGNMSLVGPRPHALGSRAGDKLFWEVDSRYWQRHSLKPGLSGLAQIRGFRGATERESDLVDRLQSDLEYLDGWTIWRDIKILVLTLRVLSHDRAF